MAAVGEAAPPLLHLRLQSSSAAATTTATEPAPPPKFTFATVPKFEDLLLEVKKNSQRKSGAPTTTTRLAPEGQAAAPPKAKKSAKPEDDAPLTRVTKAQLNKFSKGLHEPSHKEVQAAELADDAERLHVTASPATPSRRFNLVLKGPEDRILDAPREVDTSSPELDTELKLPDVPREPRTMTSRPVEK